MISRHRDLSENRVSEESYFLSESVPLLSRVSLLDLLLLYLICFLCSLIWVHIWETGDYSHGFYIGLLFLDILLRSTVCWHERLLALLDTVVSMMILGGGITCWLALRLEHPGLVRHVSYVCICRLFLRAIRPYRTIIQVFLFQKVSYLSQRQFRCATLGYVSLSNWLLLW